MTNFTRNTQSKSFTVSLLVSLCVSIIALPSQAEKSLEELKFELGANEITLAKPLKDLDARYREELEKLWEASGREGALETVLAAEKELKRFREGGPVEPVTEPKVKRLLDIYLNTKADLERTRLRGRGELFGAYLERLKELEIDLTRTGFVDEAVKVKKERDAAAAIYAELRDIALFPPGTVLRGTFHYFIDDDAWIYLNGEMISHRHKKKAGISNSGVVEVKVGDRIFAHVQNTGGAFRFRLAFLSEDGKTTIHFRTTDFVDLFDVVKKNPDFTAENLHHPDAHGAVNLTQYPNNPFEFENGSHWVWGKGGFSSLAAIVSPGMVRTVGEK